jgi:transposase
MSQTKPLTTESSATSLPNDINTCHWMIEHLLSDMRDKDREILNLKCQLESLKRRIFGRRSEKIDPHQLALFEDLTRQLEEAQAKQAAEDASQEKPKSNGRRKGHGRRPLPADLPRERVEIPPKAQELCCPNCHRDKVKIGEEVTEELDYVPASFVVRQYVRPKYACKGCEEGVVIADLPPRPIPKGIPGPGLLAHVLTSKYCDHAPLNRQFGIFRRHQVDLAISTMCDWVRDMADLLLPIVIEIKQQLLRSHHINTDDTPVLVQGLSGQPSRKGYLWVYIGDSKDVVFDFTESHSRDGPLNVLGPYSGYVQADAHSSYNALFEVDENGRESPRIEVGCWAHTRRKFYDARLDDRRRCTEMLALIGRLYDVEREAKEAELKPDNRLALRQERSIPILDDIQPRLESWSIELLPKNPVAQAVQYARNQWKALNRFLEDGRLPLDNNISERMLRMAAVGRKNYLFFGSDAGGHRAAVIYSLVASCKLIGIDPFEYLRDVIARTCDPKFNNFADLTPARWKAARQANSDS